MTMPPQMGVRRRRALGLAAAAWLAALAPAVLAEAPVSSAVEAAAPPAAPPAPTQDAPVPKKPLTTEEILELPVFKRFDIPFERGEELLADVRDNTFGYDEAAFYWVVAQVAKLPPDALRPDEECTPYSALLALPSSHRGQPVTLRGVYMTVTPFRTPAIALRKDVPTLYECNLREPPLEETRPVATVVVLENPMTYIEAFDNVRVKGYFYKIRQYEGTKGLGFAPMVIARRIELEDAPPPEAGAGTRAGGDWLALLVMAALLAGLMVAFFLVRQLGRGKPHATGERPVHRFRLRRDGGLEASAPGGPGGPGGGPAPADGPRH